MAERTKRGEEEHKREDEEMTGKPVDAAPAGAAGSGGTPPATTTRDKGAEPAKDAQQGDEENG